MTDRLGGVVVVFDADVREDDAQQVIAALRMIRGVSDVRPVVAGASQVVAEARADLRWRERIVAMMREG